MSQEDLEEPPEERTDTDYFTANSQMSEGTDHSIREEVNNERPAELADYEEDLTVYFQNVRSYARREAEVQRNLEHYHPNMMVLLETMKYVEYNHHRYQLGTNL